MVLKTAAESFATTLKSFIPRSSNPLRNHLLHIQITQRPPHFSLSLRSHPLNMSTQSSPVPPIKTMKVEIKGRVQGVFYRDWTVQNANELGLKGWVRNRRDGSVEALFSGTADKVGEMQERCRRGPPSAVVTGLNVSPCEEDPGAGFERRPTV